MNEVVTPFGAIENPQVLELIKGKNVLRIDTLESLKILWGKNILLSRNHLYRMISGNVSDEEFQKLLASYYKRYSAFANYCDKEFIFGDRNIPFVVRIIGPCRKRINEYSAHYKCLCRSSKGLYLGSHQDYDFFDFGKEQIPEVFGGDILC